MLALPATAAAVRVTEYPLPPELRGTLGLSGPVTAPDGTPWFGLGERLGSDAVVPPGAGGALVRLNPRSGDLASFGTRLPRTGRMTWLNGTQLAFEQSEVIAQASPVSVLDVRTGAVRDFPAAQEAAPAPSPSCPPAPAHGPISFERTHPTRGPDGALWAVDRPINPTTDCVTGRLQQQARIVAIGPQGPRTYALPNSPPVLRPWPSPPASELGGVGGGLLFDRGGAAWFLDGAASSFDLPPALRRLDPVSGAIESVPLPGATPLIGTPTIAGAVVTGADGRLYFGFNEISPPAGRSSRLGFFAVDPGTRRVERIVPPGGAWYAAAGADGRLWMPLRDVPGHLARYDPRTGRFARYALPRAARIGGIAAGRDGRLWLAERSDDGRAPVSIWRLDLRGRGANVVNLTTTLEQGYRTAIRCRRGCTVTSRLERRGRVVAAQQARRSRRGHVTVRLRFRHDARHALRRARSVSLRLVTRVREAGAPPRTSTDRVQLRRLRSKLVFREAGS